MYLLYRFSFYIVLNSSIFIYRYKGFFTQKTVFLSRYQRHDTVKVIIVIFKLTKNTEITIKSVVQYAPSITFALLKTDRQM